MQNQLDVHLIHNEGGSFCGFYFYEEFGESNRYKIDKSNKQKLSVCDLISQVEERARECIRDQPLPGKGGENAKAIRFARKVALHNERAYGARLNQVTATATNAVYGTDYSSSDIAKLMNR